jgi:CheY-like chemotaxis protein
MREMKKACLLIIDDSKETVEGLNCYYSQRFEVLTAYDGCEGIRQLEAADHSVDLVICDLLLPGISGFGFISMVKQYFPDIPVIAVTGWVMNPEQLTAITRADCILFKPFELEKLDEHIERLLARK